MPLLLAYIAVLGMNVAKVIDLNPFGPQGERPQRQTIGLGDAISGFQNAMAEAGLGRPEIEADGLIHRFDLPEDKPGKKAGWYVLFPDDSPCPAGMFGSWKHEISESWCAKANYELTAAQIDQSRERMRQAREARDALARENAEQCKQSAISIWTSSQEATSENPYLAKKQIGAFGVRASGSTLLVPVFSAKQELISLQRIFANGDKRPLFGTPFKESLGWIEGDHGTIYLAEGYSTAASIHMATGCAVAIGWFADNLVNSGKILRELFPEQRIVIAADDDRWTTVNGVPQNKGLSCARRAAAEIGATVVSPHFKDLHSQPTDFNDLMLLEGLEEVREQLGGSEYAFVSMAEIEAMEFEERPVIEGLLDETENLVIIGPSNIGKSLFTLHIAMAVADPEVANVGGLNLNHKPRLFGKFPIAAPRRVLFLQSENTAKATHKRMKKMLQGRPELRRSLSSIVMPTADKNKNEVRIHGPINSSFFDTARTLIRKSRADVVIIDPLISFHDADENDNVAMRAALDRFNDLSRSVGCSLIIIHHTGKDADRGGRGASAIKDWYDNALIITKASSGEDRFVIKITHDKSRNYEVKSPFYLERNKSLDFEPVENPELYLAYEAVQEAGGILTGTKDLIEAMKGISGDEKSDRTWERIIAQALREKIIAKEKQGKSVTYYIESN